jgi:hypothetical protein
MDSPCFALKRSLAACLSGLVLAGASAQAAPPAAPNAAAVQGNASGIYGGASGIYVGVIGKDDNVLLSLRGDAGISGSYHHERGWNQEVYELSGNASGQRITLRSGGNAALRAQGGRFEGSASADGATISGTWVGADGRRLPFTLTRAAAWTTQAVVADGGVRSCERPRFADARYERVNRELAEACDYFLADGHEGPGKLRLEIDSLGQYMVAAVAYAENRGRELPPEVIAVDLGSSAEESPLPPSTTLAARP